MEEVRAELRALKESYVEMLLNNRYPDYMSVTECLDIYESFLHMEGRRRGGFVAMLVHFPPRGFVRVSMELF